MRKLKKALTLTLALALSLVMAIPAMAEPVTLKGETDLDVTISDVVSQETVTGRSVLVGTGPMPLLTVKTGTTVTGKGCTFMEAEVSGDGTYKSKYPGEKTISVTEDSITLTDEHIGLWLFEGGFLRPAFYINVIAGDGTTPTQPTDPGQTTQPTDPGQTTEPEQPSEPSTPAEPEQPTQPTTPVVTDGNGNYKVHTTAGKGLNVRTGPGTEYKRACPALREGAVVEVVEIQGQWGKLANDAGWVFMPGLDKIAAAAEPQQPAQPEQTFPVTMQVENSMGALNVRTGPGTNYKKAGPSLKNGTEIEVVEIQGQWGKLANDAGWVYLPGAKTVKG